MPTPLRPASTPTFGRKNWSILTNLASTSLIPSVTEMSAVSALDVTDILFAEGSDRPTQNTNLTEALRRWGDKNVYQNIGQTTYAGGNLQYAFGAQGDSASDGKKLFELIPDGATRFLVERLGIDKATNPTAGQFVNVFPVRFGPSMPMEVGEGENAEAGAMCTFAVTGPPAFNVALTA